MKQEIIFLKQNELMSRKHKKVCTTLNCIELYCIASFISIPIVITNSAIGLNICAITTGIKMYKAIIKKKKKQPNKIVFLAKSKLNKIEILISKTLFDSAFSHDAFVLVNNVLT